MMLLSVVDVGVVQIQRHILCLGLSDMTMYTASSSVDPKDQTDQTDQTDPLQSPIGYDNCSSPAGGWTGGLRKGSRAS